MKHRNFDTTHLGLDRHSGTPLYRQLYERIRGAIASGVLRPGDRLPSARALASQVSAARGTVDLCYNLLSSEGYVESRGAAGTFVSPRLNGARVPQYVRPRTRTGHRAPAADNLDVAPFTMGLPALDAFPLKLWSRLTGRHARNLPLNALSEWGSIGHGPLRDAVASYVTVARGVSCAPGDVIITPGFQGALGLIATTLMESGDAVWFEDPGYFAARRALEASNVKLIPVPVDNEGMIVRAGIDRSSGARFAYVSPSHQMPLAAALTLSRRIELLDWAHKANAWIIEDDYDSEFRYGSRPLPALKSLDEHGRVLYVGSFSKVLFPGLRLGYLIAPNRIRQRLSDCFDLLYRDLPLLGQAVTADFMSEGHFARHIRRMRTLYAERRDALVESLGRVFECRLRIEFGQGGMHLLALGDELTDDVRVTERAASMGLAPVPLSRFGLESKKSGLLLSFTNIPAKAANEAARRLERVLDSLK